MWIVRIYFRKECEISMYWWLFQIANVVVHYPTRITTDLPPTGCRDTLPTSGSGKGCWGLLLDPRGTLVLICVCFFCFCLSWVIFVLLSMDIDLLYIVARKTVGLILRVGRWCLFNFSNDSSYFTRIEIALMMILHRLNNNYNISLILLDGDQSAYVNISLVLFCISNACLMLVVELFS